MKVISKQKQTSFIVAVFITAFLLGYLLANKQKNDSIIELKQWQGRKIEEVKKIEQMRPVWKVVVGKMGKLCKKHSGFSY